MPKGLGRFSGAILVGLLATLPSPARAGSASLLLDITPGGAPESRVELAGPALSLGQLALFPIFRSGSWETWVTDGTEVGTRSLLASAFQPLGAAGRIGIFEFGERLLRSDGTRSGTFPLTPEPEGELLLCEAKAALGSVLLLSIQSSRVEPCVLWVTDGTPEGTVPLPALEPGRPTAAGHHAFFASFDGAAATSLWRTDGTPEGTVRLRSWARAQPEHFVAVGERLFFTAPDEGQELWTSDGTVAGTRPLTRFAAEEPFVLRSTVSAEILLQETGGQACFVAQEGTAGRELWCSDGTPSGTRRATSLLLANPFVNVETWRVERLGGRLLFPANDGTSGNRWWTSDGRPDSTVPLTGCPGGCPLLDLGIPPVRVGSQAFFVALPPSAGLWVTDGTGAGTRQVGSFCDTCQIGRMFPLLGRLVFSASDRSYHSDLWISDGTRLGTRLLAPVAGHPDEVLSFPPVAVGGRGLLVAGRQLWVSDGTPEGTGRLTLLGRDGLGSSPRDLIPAPGGLWFVAQEWLWSSGGTPATTARVEAAPRPGRLTALGPLTLFLDQGQALWRSDGTAAGTYRLALDNVVREPVAVAHGAVFVRAETDPYRLFLWATDGTAAGTRKITGLLPNSDALLLPAGASALIVQSTGSEPVLWRTDGTAAGTREIHLPEEFGLFDPTGVRPAAQLGDALFLSAHSGSGRERVWRMDPSATRILTTEIQDPGSLATHAGALYILGLTDPPDEMARTGLWRSDGTEAGTVLLASVPRPGPGSPPESELASVGDLLFFTLEDERGRELWRTDGTPEGTFLVRDILPGELSSRPAHLTALGGRLYFTASSLEHGTELWESDGTEEGTRLVQDIEPGASPSRPEDLVASGGKLFFTAEDSVHGREPWVYEPDVAGCIPSDTALCLGGHFRVEADWRDARDGGGRGRAVALTPDTGTFWFFDAANVEVILKVLDGRGLNGHHWVFYGALSNVEYALTVTDTETGAVRRYLNPPGRLGSVADTTAFGPLGSSVEASSTRGPAPSFGEAVVSARTSAVAGSCVSGPSRLCLQDGRFAVEARWKKRDGTSGAGRAVPLGGGDTGYFWFFDASNVEVVLKVLDGRPLNDRFWVFYGALSDVEYTITVTDSETGAVKTYTNPQGRLASVADTGAF